METVLTGTKALLLYCPHSFAGVSAKPDKDVTLSPVGQCQAFLLNTLSRVPIRISE